MKVKMFYDANTNNLETEINKWLSHNSGIEIISTDSFANVGGWGYMILYRRKNS
jgi:hypothetical protein